MSIKRQPRAARANRIVLYRAELLEARFLLSTVSWDGGGDGVSWNDPRNWSNDSLPTASDDVVISIPASNPVMFFVHLPLVK